MSESKMSDNTMSKTFGPTSATGRHIVYICTGNVKIGFDKRPEVNCYMYRKTSNISRTLVGNKIVDNSDVVGASPVGAAPTTSSFPT